MDELAAARALLPDARLELVERLRGGDRSSVYRVRGTVAGRPGTELVVKQFHTAGENWVRETAALQCLRGAGSDSDAAAAPQLVACGPEPPLLVVEYLGSGPSLADALLGDDPALATAALCDWATAVARVHAASRELRGGFAAALADRQGDLPVADSTMAAGIEETVRRLDEECAALGIPIPTGSFDALRGLESRLGGGRLGALTPSDTCPDNNVRTAQGLVLLDFEDAQWRHIAWDVAYLRVPWPSCWCSWALPDAAAEVALDAYRRRASAAFPEVADDQFTRDVDAAAVGWSFISTIWFLSAIRAGDAPSDPDRPAPSRRAMVAHRLARSAAVAESCGLAPLGELADQLAQELARRFGACELEPAPAFRQTVADPSR
jgi:hypothetical protein